MMGHRKLFRGMVVAACALGAVSALSFLTQDVTATTNTLYYSYPCPTPSGGRDYGQSTNGLETFGQTFNPRTGFWNVTDFLTGANPIFNATWGQWGDIPVAGDFNGDGDSDLAYYRPNPLGAWYVKCSSTTNCPSGTLTVDYGVAGDLPIPADYDNDGFTDYGVWRPSTGRWFVRSGATGTALVNNVQWGQFGDCPVPARFAGSGAGSLELNIFRPLTGTWFYGKSLAGVGGSTVSFGTYGDIPFPYDADGDGDGDVMVWRPSNGTWYGQFPSFQVQFGQASDIPMSRNKTAVQPFTVGVFRPSNGYLYLCLTPSGTGCSGGIQTWGPHTSHAGDVFMQGAYK